jgi:nitrate/nitrite transport system substrate-binding protein
LQQFTAASQILDPTGINDWHASCSSTYRYFYKEPAMSIHKPFDPDRPLFSSRCSCGMHASAAEHEAAKLQKINEEQESANFIEASLVKALFPQEARRRAFLRAVGTGGAMGALSGFLPVGALQAMAQEKAPLEKRDLKIGFIAITCATPLIMADPLGFYKKQGLNVTLNKTAGWALIRDKMLSKEHDAFSLANANRHVDGTRLRSKSNACCNYPKH